MFAVPVKKTDKVVFAVPLRKYIASTYKMDPGPHEADLAELDALRETVSNTPTVENCSLYARTGAHITA